MSGSVVADFVAEAVYAGAGGDEPTQARVLLSEDRLVLAGDEGRTVIPLDHVHDVVVSKVPEDLGGFFDQSVLVAYQEGDDRRTALIRGEHDRIDRFALFLYKAILRGHPAEIRHPVREGGRVRDPALRRASIVPRDDAIRFRSQDGDVILALDDVVGVDYQRREVEGRDRQLLAVKHRDGDAVATTEIYHDDANRLSVLARHIRSEYYRAEEILDEVELDEREQRALVALYAGVAPASLASVVADDEGETVDARALLQGLAGKGLLEDVEAGTLTHDGALVAIHRIEDVES